MSLLKACMITHKMLFQKVKQQFLHQCKRNTDEAVDEAGQMIQELLSGRDREMARIQQLAGVR